MEVLRISAVGGLYNEFFNPNSAALQKRIVISNHTLNGSGLFWYCLFQRSRIEKLIGQLKDNMHSERWNTPQYRSITANPQEFLSRSLNAFRKICCPTCTEKSFFSHLETLNILCALYSDFEFAPFRLTVQDGFVLNDQSALALYQESLHPKLNPYLAFVDRYVIPLVQKSTPSVLLVEGKLNHYSTAVAMRAKSLFPDIHVCLTRHASEYYSLNKITNLLKQNDALFSIVDSIVLEFFSDTEQQLVAALLQQRGLQDVPNLLYKNSLGEIQETSFKAPAIQTGVEVYMREYNSSADIHLEPFVKCHWNKCSFCGINRKYHFEDAPFSKREFLKKVDRIKDLSHKCRFFWFIDEALIPEKMRLLSEVILDNNIQVFWQARCRASIDLLQKGTPNLLYKAGLRELRIGLESASYSVLRLMNKFDQSFSLEVMEKIIKTYTNIGISIHCPMIVGFPQESTGDRKKTYEFLSDMRKKYPLFTFNLNILCLDTSSFLYQKHAEYQIQNIKFPCSPKYFLGNSVEWMSPSTKLDLDIERQTFMREQLYPWMPRNALTSPTLLYRLTETARRTLVWKSKRHTDGAPSFGDTTVLRLSPALAISEDGPNQYLIYCWESHHYMEGNGFLLQLLDMFVDSQNVSTAILNLEKQNPSVFQRKELFGLIYRLFCHGYLVLS